MVDVVLGRKFLASTQPAPGEVAPATVPPAPAPWVDERRQVRLPLPVVEQLRVCAKSRRAQAQGEFVSRAVRAWRRGVVSGQNQPLTTAPAKDAGEVFKTLPVKLTLADDVDDVSDADLARIIAWACALVYPQVQPGDLDHTPCTIDEPEEE